MLFLHGTMIAAPLLMLVLHAGNHVFGFCLFKKLSGIDCPACGITHSVMAMMSGHPTEALRFHPAGPAVLILLAGMTAYLGATLLTRFKGLEWRCETAVYHFLDYAMVGILLAGWCVKLCIN